MKIAVIDYKMSNMFSIKNALDNLGHKSIVTSNQKEIFNSDAAVLPGVGSFPEAMKHLNDLKLVEVIKKFIETGKPFMGICLGLQLLFSKSEEFNQCRGLDIINGTVESFSKYLRNKPIPHVGWNKIVKNNLNETESNNNSKVIFDNNDYYYFVHSFFVKPENIENVYTFSKYGEFNFCSSILIDNIFACQFHPEKSGQRGLEILNNFFV